MPQERNTVSDTSANGPEAKTETLTIEEDRRAALEAALAEAKEGKEEAHQEGQVEASGDTDSETASDVSEEPQLPPLEPPAEFTPDEKEDFKNSSRKSQEAQLRLHRQRTAAFTREFGSTKKLTESVRTYLDIMGKKGVPAEQAMQSAIALYHEFETNPDKAVKEFARVKNLKVKFEDEQSSNSEKNNSENYVQPQLKAVTDWIASEQMRRTGEVLSTVWSGLEQATNAAGKPLFPDLNNTESGIELARNIGTLIRNADFQHAVRSRIPGAGLREFVVEAYRWHGGRVDESEAPRSQGSQTQIAKSRRASASVPGRGAQTARASDGKKYSTYREAAMAALAQLNSD